MSWYQLLDTLKEQVAYQNYYRSQPPVACPWCGTPLLNGPPQAEALLYCPNDGWQFPRDYDEDSMAGM